MKKYLIISMIIHILIVPAIVYSVLNKDFDEQYYDFEVTVDTSNFNSEVVISEKSMAKAEVRKKNVEDDMDDLEIEEEKNGINLEQKKKKNDKGKDSNKEILSKEQKYYIDIINGKVSGYKLTMPKYPPVAKKWGYTGTTIVDITIDTFGNVVDVKVKKSSGYSILDRTVVSTIINKWKNLPKPNEKIVVSKAFEFEID